MLLAVGEQFGDFNEEIRGGINPQFLTPGCVFSRRKAGDKIAVWTGNAANGPACLEIGFGFYSNPHIIF